MFSKGGEFRSPKPETAKMKKSFNGYEAIFTVKYTEIGKEICYSVLEVFGFANSWADALETVREWTEENAFRQSISDADYDKIALMYASESGYTAKKEGFKWVVRDASGEAVEVSKRSAYNDEQEAMIGWAAPRMDIDFIRSRVAGN
jgi:hypothetical protein